MTASVSQWPPIRPRTVLWLLLVVLGVLAIAFVAKALFVLFAGVLLALLLKTFAEVVVRFTRIPYRGAVVMLVVLALASIIVGALLMGPRMVDQFRLLGHDLPRAADQIFQQVRQISGTVALPRAEELAPEPKTIAAGATGAFMGSIEVLAAFVVIAFVGIYGALDPGAYARVILTVVPEHRKARAAEVIHETAHRLARWLVGRIIAMAFVGVFTIIGLWIIDIPLAFTLGLLAGMFTFVEYVGAVTSAIPPMLLALTSNPMKALWVAVLFTIVHVVEGYVLTPIIARRAVHFPPAYTLAAQTLFGALFGVIGITFATPTCIIAATLIEKLYVEDVLGKKNVSESR